MVVRADVFNVFNWDSEIEVEEEYEDDDGNLNPNYKSPTDYQSPRRARLSVNYRF